jgi:hypothetical protein
MKSQRPRRAAGLLRPALQPGLHRAGAQAAGRRLAHRLPAARRRGPRRRHPAGERAAAGSEPAEHDGRNGGWAPIWTGLYKASALTLDRYRHGRVLLAGDAAHLVPIFGVRGANSGIDDADNLAWKLAWWFVARLRTRLLDSYSQERVAAAHENLAYGCKSTEFMAPPDFAFDLMRTAVLGLAVRHPALRPLISPRRPSTVCYHDSPLNAWPERSAAFAAGPEPGQVLPECPITLADGSRGYVTDWFTGGFARCCGSPMPARRPGTCWPGPTNAASAVFAAPPSVWRSASGTRVPTRVTTRPPVRTLRRAAGQSAAGAAGWPSAGPLAGRAAAGGTGRSRCCDAGPVAAGGRHEQRRTGRDLHAAVPDTGERMVRPRRR